jgi:PAS domain S-box-containing protein
MAKAIPWRSTLAVKLGGILLALLALSLLLLLGNLYLLASVQWDSDSLNTFGRGRYYGYATAYLASRLFDEKEAGRVQTQRQLDDMAAAMDQRFERLLTGAEAVRNSQVRQGVQQDQKAWERIKESLRTISSRLSREEAKNDLFALGNEIDALVAQINAGSDQLEKLTQDRMLLLRYLQGAFGVLVLAIIGLAFWLTHDFVHRTRALAGTVERITAGELDQTASVSGNDELAALCTAFNAMTANLRTTLAKETDEKTRNRAILDSTADGILTLDEKGTINATNSAVERLFGYKGDGLVGRNVSVVVPALYQEGEKYEDRDVRPGEAQAIGGESVVTGNRRDGTHCTLALRVSEMTYHGEKLFIATLRDITKTRKIEEERSRVLAAIREAVAQLSSASAQILTSTQQQAAGAQEQAAAVTETVATVEEVTQTAEHAAQRAQGVGEAVQHTLEVGRAGRKTVEESIAALDKVREQVEATAETILALAEQAQAIGEITATVADIAEQTNLLALNAAIEASRAGEHGRAFSVVAGEVKALADQSKKATAQVRQILGEVQKATNAAVLSTEEVTKGVATAGAVSAHAGETIRALAETLAEAAQAAAQIAASAGQQATGMAQIHHAMHNIDQVAKQNLAAVRQAEQAAQNLNALGGRLSGIVGS